MLVAIIILAWFGLAFGSFVNALVWRVHEQGKAKNRKNKSVNLSIVNGRSICPNCRHILAWYDLIPLFSWLALRGRCRYCKKPVSKQYPLVEVAQSLVFVLSYIWWPGGLHGGGDWTLFITWLATSVGLMALLVYDARWMLLPNRILYPTFYIALAGRLVYLIGFEGNKAHALLMWILSVAVSSGIFWILFVVSKGKWIGFGDIRLGLVTGTLLASPSKSFLMIMLGSLLGTLFILPALLLGKKKMASKLPYGPFLIAGTFIALFFGDKILDWYSNFLKIS
jgi:prepilin signal peptidase PulO-like enzyme (type II secretory pathway)